MRRATRQRLWLLGGAVALALAAGWQWQRDRAGDPGSLLSTPPSAISAVNLRIGHAPEEHYTLRQGHWWRTDGDATRADDGRLGELTETAAAAVLSWRPASDFDPAKIGLMPPVAVLTLNGQALEFGETSVTGPQRYVRVGDRVALISLSYTPRAAAGQATQAH
ncbi:hypothetical protein [Dyella sp. ASV21]|jgi:hypothetical protein|uniref:hypothetical protein n=1 Tax=Dyella sp. ASV21 TaxID=2795114 RepID=UPI0018EB5063|nr:hypothetical protein [Dyella sp. ASV21]